MWWPNLKTYGKEKTMKKYVTLNGKEVQKALIGAGFKWHSGNQRVNCLGSTFLFITDGRLSHANNFIYTVAQIKSYDYIPINPGDIIANPFALDGAKQPEKIIMIEGKEVSESTIAMALKKMWG